MLTKVTRHLIINLKEHTDARTTHINSMSKLAGNRKTEILLFPQQSYTLKTLKDPLIRQPFISKYVVI